ncbi:D123-domain-containing protein [Lipomyces japonicus]|uniref:D123-domain-containing protein n=1 Tax=Lipomyces japonicus TaxID=56871 RepID=UPI0034CECE31
MALDSTVPPIRVTTTSLELQNPRQQQVMTAESLYESDEEPQLLFTPVTRQQVKNCTFSAWYTKYKKISPRATVIKPVGEAFVKYLLSDGIYLPPEGDQAEWSDSDDELTNRIQELSTNVASFSDTGESDDDDADWDADNDENSDPATAFPELDQQLRQVLADYGAVVPKLNWSAPKDAAWITTTNSLKCVTPGDVYLILKSSNFITHDLLHAFDDCHPGVPSLDVSSSTNTIQSNSNNDHEDVELVLRKWVDFNPAMEFRCFVKDRTLIGISQRDENFYDFLQPLGNKLLELIDVFFSDYLQDSFANESFVFDVYIPKPHHDGKVWLIDINPFGPRTDTLLYTWQELLSINPHATGFDDSENWPEIRLLNANEGMQSFARKPFSEHMVPKDVVDASIHGGGAGIAAFAKKWKDMLHKHESNDSRSSG